MTDIKEKRIRISKAFTFDMAHALFGHQGPCRNIHGHTYTFTVTLLGVVKDLPGNTEDGMVVDFTFLKDLVNKEIINYYDHALVLNGDSEHRKIQFGKEFEKVIFLDKQPTCENLLLSFVELLKGKLPPTLELNHAGLRETPSSCAEWFKEDNL